MNMKLQAFYVCEWILLTTVSEFKINIKQEEVSSHRQLDINLKKESCEMLTFEHYLWG
jgi:hypothetical protein